MSESRLWVHLRSGMQSTDWVAERVENKIGVDFPDVCYTVPGNHGFIELKYLHHWPKDPQTVIKFKDNIEGQKRWAKRRGELNGHCLFLLWIEETAEYFLFNDISAQILNRGTQSELRCHATMIWTVGIYFPQLYDILTDR